MPMTHLPAVADMPPVAAPLRLQILGDFAVSLGETPIPLERFGRRKALSLLKLLALQPQHRLHREAALEALWADLEPEAGAAQLYNALYRIRKGFTSAGAVKGDALLELKSEVLRLYAEVDADLFLAAANRALERNEAEALAAALALYRGALLPDDPYEDWTQEARVHLSETYLSLLLKAAEVATSAGRLEQATEHLNAATLHDPACEEAHVALFELYAREGNSSGLKRHYERYCESLKDLGLEPDPTIRARYEELLKTIAATRTPSLPTHALPAPSTPFFGREREFSDVLNHLRDPQCRLLTLVGAGGIGKSRLALEGANESLPDFPQGAYLVELEDVQPDDMLPAILRTLGLRAQAGAEPLETLRTRLQGRKVLLILDSLEAHLEGAPLIGKLLDSVPGLKIVATSRERLNLRAEWVLELGGLLYPQDARENPLHYPAGQLFLGSVRRAEPGFRLEPRDHPLLQRLLTLVEGVPLALELAASWLRLLPLGEVVSRLEKSLDPLESSLRDLPPRHRSMRTVFGRSIAALGNRERDLLRRSAVFRGGFSLEAATGVLGASPADLLTLVDKSFLRRSAGGRFEMQALLRLYCEERLREDSGLYDDMSLRHTAHYAQYLAAREDSLRGSGMHSAMRDLSAEQPNLVRAWRYALELKDSHFITTMLPGLITFLTRQNRLREAESLLDEAARAFTPPIILTEELLGKILARQGAFRVYLENYTGGKDLLERSLAFLNNPGERVFPLSLLGLAFSRMGLSGEAEEKLGAALSLSCYAHWTDTCLALDLMGDVLAEAGRYEEAESYYTRSLEGQRHHGDPRGIAAALTKESVTLEAHKISLVQNSFMDITPISDRAAAEFYERLFSLDPDTRRLFRLDIKSQGKKLMDLLEVAIKGLSRLETILPNVRELGRRHLGYGVKDEHYDTVAQALLWMLERNLGDSFTPEVKEAWTEAYGLLADVMKEGAGEAVAV